MSTEAFEGVTAEQLRRMKSMDFVRFLSAKAASGNAGDPAHVFRTRWPRSLSVDVVSKAAVGAGDMTLAHNTPAALSAAFIASAQPQTALARLGLRKVPSNTPLNRATAPASFHWVGEALAAPVSKLTFAAENALRPLKSSGVIAVAAEVLKLTAPGAEDYVLSELRTGYVKFLDDALLNPTHSGSANVQPASITANAAVVAATGVTAAAAVYDLRHALELFIGIGGHVETCVVVMEPENATALNLTGEDVFRDLRRDGGMVGGLPVVTSSSCGAQIVLVDVAHVLYADEGEADFDIATHASVEMEGASMTQDGSTGTGSNLVSFWQSGLAGIKIERWLNWKADTGAVARVSGAQYYNVGSPS